MSTVNKCIKESKPIELTLNDCLSCSGCITTSEKSDLMQSDLTKLIDSPKNKSFLISPFSKLNTYNHFITKGYKLTFNDFELHLTNFFIKNNCKILDTSFYLNDILTNLKKEFLQTKKLIVSDCPGTVKYIERNGHHLVDWLSKVYSPQEISVIQNNNTLPIVSVIPCLDKKLEKIKVDYYLTTKEFIDFLECNNFTFDEKIRLEKNKSNFRNSFSGGYTQFMLHELKDEFVLEEKGKGFLVYKSEKYALYQVYGLKNLLNFINLTRKGLEFSFAEIFLCENACVNGPARAKLSLQNEVDVIYQSVSDNNTVGLNCFGKQFEVKKIRKVNFKVEW